MSGENTKSGIQHTFTSKNTLKFFSFNLFHYLCLRMIKQQKTWKKY